ncbi:FkbM family methyltransferase [Flavobacterium sp.]|uniref:FkbM family methyltransferase n=1 Tax=Flavobacterium sp. TaxID=239 RepID=UPI003528CD42
MNKFQIAQIVCSYLPPIISQNIRNKIVTIQDGEKLKVDFKKRSITGSIFPGNTSDFHAMIFGVNGFYDWRNIILVHEILKHKKGDIIEVGANVGTETIALTDLASPNSVYAFEPLPQNFEYLRKIINLNSFNNLFIYNQLVSDFPGKTHFKIPNENQSGSGHIASSSDKNTQEFEVITLDEKLAHLNSFSTILIDVEGFEYQVLKGGLNLINKFKPYVICEVNKKFLQQRGGLTIEQFFGFFESNNYTPYYIDRFGLKKVDIQNFELRYNKNWLCIPNEYLAQQTKLSNAIAINAFNPLIKHVIL